MNMRCKILILMLVLSSATPMKTIAAPRHGATLRQIAAIDLPGPVGKRFDYLTVDVEDGYVLSAHLGAGLLYVIDIKTNKVIDTIYGLPGVEGVEYVPIFKKIYTSDWYENKIGVIDLTQREVIKKLPTGAKPDESTYAASFHKLYVSNERGKSETVVDVTTDRVVATLHFNSETGMPQYDSVAKRVYVNLQDQNILAEIDPTTDSVVGRYPVGRCKGNHGMALDVEHRRAFLSCEGNDTMTVFDLEKHEPIAYLPMASGADVIKFDDVLSRIYVACSSGAISVFKEDDPTHFRKVEDFPVEPKVHSLAIDPTTHRVYTPEEQEDGRPVARMIVYEPVTKD